MKPASPSCSPAATSAANSVYGYETTLPVTVDELIPLVRAVAGSALRALVADLRFGSYQESPEQC